MTNSKWQWNGNAKRQLDGRVTQAMARPIPLGIRRPDRPSDSHIITEDTSLISPYLLYKFIFLSSQSDRVLAESWQNQYL
jgi:hypothetical protein